MLGKCANPACSASFRYLHEGKLFATRSRMDPPWNTTAADREYAATSPRPRYFWLCSSCNTVMTLRPDGDNGVTVVPKQAMPPNAVRIEDAIERVA
jgi:hypothetical protein